jgi:hypothetical protein
MDALWSAAIDGLRTEAPTTRGLLQSAEEPLCVSTAISRTIGFRRPQTRASKNDTANKFVRAYDTFV